MRPAKSAPPTDAAPVERWTIVQVAAFLGLSYQTARNNMLSRDYGPSAYDAKTRTLTVSADMVRAVHDKREKKRRRRR